MKPCIVITGMHRSGTSFLARACNLGGVYFGELDEMNSNGWNDSPDNEKGHWENQDILKLSENTLLHSLGRWDSIPDSICCSDITGLEIEHKINYLAEPPSLAWGFKEPRFPILYESWAKHLPPDFLVMAIFRHPLKVAQSLAQRNGFDYEKSIKLWTIHNEKLLSLLETHPGFLFSFDWNKEEIIKEIKLVFYKIGLCNTVDFNDWYSKDMLHSDDTYDSSYVIPRETQIIYDKLVELSKKNANVDLKIRCNLLDLKKLCEHLYKTIQKNERYFKLANLTIKNRYGRSKMDFKALKERLEEDMSTKSEESESLKSKLKFVEIKYREYIEGQEITIKENKVKLDEMNETLQEKDEQIQEKDVKLNEDEKTIKSISEKRDELQQRSDHEQKELSIARDEIDVQRRQLSDIYNSHTWKILYIFNKIRHRLQ